MLMTSRPHPSRPTRPRRSGGGHVARGCLVAGCTFLLAQSGRSYAQDEVPEATPRAEAPAPATPTETSPAPEVAPPVPAAPTMSSADVAETLQAMQELRSLDLEALLQYTVVTATKSELKEDEAPAITTVVTREEIQRWGYQSVEEVLHHVAGVYVVNDHIIPNLAVRGIAGGLRSESGLVKVMID